MIKKNSTLDEKRFEVYALSVYLANECYKRDNQSGKTANRGYDGTIKQNTLASVLADKATIVSQRLTFIGYLKIAVTLLKVAFRCKKHDGTSPVFRGIFSIQ